MRRHSKYNSKWTEVDGIWFQSAKEAKRYQELKLLEKAGAISDLKLQVKMPVMINGELCFTYKADFCFWDRKNPDAPVLVYEDVKGFKTKPK